MNRPEQQIQRAAADLLAILYPPYRSAVIWYHPPLGGQRSAREAAIMAGLGVHPGVADLAFQWGNGSAAIEIKAGRGKLSPAQERFRDWCYEAGVWWSLCRSLDEIEAQLEQWVGMGMPEPACWGRRRRRANNPAPARVLSSRR